ncbi:ferrous iron transport protein B [Magnetovirga frankeli]|uniref:ferrous iron transport protein B n=1 Tax=Magnetovirga frankeli TaxID=947516 RepID=UPI00029CF242|nr:magnetosome protein [gamma proteobacterium SS-5]QFY90105.1 ferrous iron transport protein B [gamma proteobacterium SS-5]
MADPKQTTAKPIKVALVGNPNTGRTTLFNQLTKSRGGTGNYPRVTVGVKSKVIEHKGWAIEVVDLPGIYSLSSRTDEELQSREFIYQQQPDMLINVVDMGHLERNLLLTSQLIEMGVPRIIALNMKDEAQHKGVEVELATFSTLLDSPVVEMEARNGKGVTELLDSIVQEAEKGFHHDPIRIPYDDHLEEAIERVTAKYRELHSDELNEIQIRWQAIKLLEGDDSVLQQESDHSALMAMVEEEQRLLKEQHDESAALMLNDGRYGFVNGLMHETVSLNMDTALQRVDVTRVLDSVLLHRWLGLPLFLGFMWLMFETTFTLGAYPMDWIDMGVGALSDGLNQVLPEGLFKDLIINGIIAGVGGTIIFLPNIVILFFFIALFSETGYLSRSAFLIDRMMHSFGLHGKAFIPMLTGFGCNVPAIMATRTIENKKDRLVAMLVIPFMSCGARLPVYILFISVFFADNSGTVLFSIYLIGIVVALFAAVFLSKTVVRGANTSPFLMELPPYRKPSYSAVMNHMGESALEFLKKVGGIIVIGSIIIWLLQTFPQEVPLSQDYAQEIASLEAQPESEARNEQIGELNNAMAAEIQRGRYLGQIGAVIEPIFHPLGFDLNASIAILTGIVAKEVIVATFGVLNAQGEEATEEDTGLRAAIASSMTATSAFAFMIFSLFYMPCFATIAMFYRESDSSLAWTGFMVAFSTSIAYALALLVVLVGP